MNSFVKPRVWSSFVSAKSTTQRDNGGPHFDYNFFRDELFPHFQKFRIDEKISDSKIEDDGTHVYGLGNAKFSNVEQFLADSIKLMEVFKK